MPKDFNELTDEELELIVREGLKSDFWKLLTNDHEIGQKGILDQVVSLRLTSWDDLVRIVGLLASYKSREENYNYPMSILKAIEVNKQNQSNS